MECSLVGQTVKKHSAGPGISIQNGVYTNKQIKGGTIDRVVKIEIIF